MVPEWVDAYMDYDSLKIILRQIRLSRLPKTPHTPLSAFQRKFSIYSPLRVLKVESRSQQNEGDLEEQVIKFSPIVGENDRTMYRTRLLLPPDNIGREFEVEFFKKLDEELNKVNAFYWEKMEKVVKEAAELNKQMDAYVALRIKVRHPSFKQPDPDAAKALTGATPGRGIDQVNNLELMKFIIKNVRLEF